MPDGVKRIEEEMANAVELTEEEWALVRRVLYIQSKALRPAYVLRMACTHLGHPGGLGRGAPKRALKAARELDEIYRGYGR